MRQKRNFVNGLTSYDKKNQFIDILLMKELKMYEDFKLDYYIVHEVHMSIFI